MPTSQIAVAMGISQRYVFKLLAMAKDFQSTLPQTALAYETLPEPVQETLEFTPKGFKLFYERYSGLPLPNHCYEWVRQALGFDRVLINCPPRHAKSKIFSVWFPIWLVSRNRDVQIIIASQTVDLANKFTREIAYHFEQNTKLIAELGRFLPTNEGAPWRPAQGELLVEGRQRAVLPGDMTIQARGAGQAILGMEAEWIIVDDPVSRKHVTSETDNEKLSTWFHGDVMTRLQPDGHVLVIGQRLALNDLYGELADKRVPELGEDHALWKHLNYPAVSRFPKDDEPALVLWPEIWPYEKLMQRRADVVRKGGTGLWETMFQQNPLADSEVLVPRSWIYGEPGCLDRWRTLGQGLDPTKRRCRVMSLDPSPTQFAGLIVADVGLGQEPDIHVVDLIRDRMGVREMIQNFESLRQRYYPINYLIIETNVSRFFMDGHDFKTWSRTSGIRIVGHATSRNKQDPQWGLNSLAIDFEVGRIRMPAGDKAAERVMQQLIDEATQHPYHPTDDLLMALWFIKYNWRRLPPVKYDRFPGTQGAHSWHIPERLESGWHGPWEEQTAVTRGMYG